MQLNGLSPYGNLVAGCATWIFSILAIGDAVAKIAAPFSRVAAKDDPAADSIEYMAPLLAALAEVGALFAKDELAYLALTQKMELVIRDKLAFALHRRLEGRDGILVCREWRRSDIALLERGRPRLVIEAKAIYTLDIVKGGVPHPYAQLLEQDVLKALARKSVAGVRELEVATLLLATHPYAAPHRVHKPAIKYFGGLARYPGDKMIKSDIETRVTTALSQHRILEQGSFVGGRAFGIDVDVLYWLCGPYRPGHSWS